MSKKINFRAVFILLLGFLLLLSLFICVRTFKSEEDLVATTAQVMDVTTKKSVLGTKSEALVTYVVNGVDYQYNFSTYKDIYSGDNMTMYYHANDVISVQKERTSKLIFLCPFSGFLLVLISIFDFIGSLKKSPIKDELIDYDENYKTEVVHVVGNTEQLKIIPEEVDDDLDIPKLADENEEVSVKEVVKKADEVSKDIVPFMEEEKEVKLEIPEIKKVKKEEKVDYRKVLPKYYYLSGNTLVCEMIGDVIEEIPLEKVVRVVKTINSESQLVKLTVYTDEVRCLLAHMYKVDLDSIVNQIHNKMLHFDSSFKEDVEYKEY